MVMFTRSRLRRDDIVSQDRQVEKVGRRDEPGSAVTLPGDLKLAEDFRVKYLRKRNDLLGAAARYLRMAWARIEVHTGAYMFDTREHVIFYALFAALVYLICTSLMHVGYRVVGWLSLHIL